MNGDGAAPRTREDALRKGAVVRAREAYYYDTVMDAYAIYEKYFVPDAPNDFLIDRSGVIRFRKRGFYAGDEKALESEIVKLLDETPVSSVGGR